MIENYNKTKQNKNHRSAEAFISHARTHAHTHTHTHKKNSQVVEVGTEELN